MKDMVFSRVIGAGPGRPPRGIHFKRTAMGVPGNGRGGAGTRSSSLRARRSELQSETPGIRTGCWLTNLSLRTSPGATLAARAVSQASTTEKVLHFLPEALALGQHFGVDRLGKVAEQLLLLGGEAL